MAIKSTASFELNSMPPGWVQLPRGIVMDAQMWYHAKKRLRVVVNIEFHDDARIWQHVSVSHPRRVPKHEEMCYIKKHVIGDGRKAIAVFPAREYHVNIHPYCLHLFACLSECGDGLPEFSTDTVIGRGI
jgi:hypothetical protein